MKKVPLILLCLLLALGFVRAQAPEEISQEIQRLSLKETIKEREKLYKEGAYQKGLPYAQSALQKARATQQLDSTLVDAIMAVASYYKRLARYPEALELNKESEQLGAKLYGKKSDNYISCLNNLATAYGYLGYDEIELQLKEEMSKISEEVFGKQSAQYARSLYQRAAGLAQKQRTEEAITLYEEAIQIVQDVLGKDDEMLISPLMGLGNIYLRQKKFVQAETLFKEAGRISEKVYGVLNTKYISYMFSMTNLYVKTGRYPLAEELYKKIIETTEKSSGKAERYADAQRNLAAFYIDQKRYPEATPHLTESLNIIEQALGKYHPKYAAGLLVRTQQYYEQDSFQNALHTALYSLHINCELAMDSSALEKTILNMRQIKSFKNGDSAIKAIEWVQKCLMRLYEQNRERRMQRLLLYASKAGVFLIQEIKKDQIEADKFASLRKQVELTEVAMYAANELVEYELAFALSEQSKAVLLSDALQNRLAKTFGDLPDSLANREKRLQEQLAIAQKNMWQSEDDAVKRQTYLSEWNSKNREYQQFMEQLAQQYPRYQALKNTDAVAEIWQIQDLLSPKAVFLEYHVMDSTLMLFRITKQNLKVFNLRISEDSLLSSARQLRNALTDYLRISQYPEESYTEYTQAAHALYLQLLEPALKNLTDIDQLIIVPDGVLGHLPFETFLAEPAPQSSIDYKNLHYLLRDYKISYNYSATLWKENRQSISSYNNGEMLAFAADYSNTSNADTAALARGANRSVHTRNMRMHLAQLPSVRNEVLSLEQYFNGKFLTDSAANEATFKELAPRYGVLHLAMHGLLDIKYPILSALAFTENGDTTEDNFLQAYEISHLNLNTDLVVLSACETGYGKFQAGEGVMSLARSFMYAGVPSLVVSLWEVNDASTSQLMRSFYENLYSGYAKDAALQRAKLDYIEQASGATAHPAYWSAFVQLGDSSALRVQTKWNWMHYTGIGVGALALLGGGWWLWQKRRKKK